MSLASPVASGSGPAAAAAASAEQLIDDRIQQARSALWWAELSRSGLRMLIVWLVAVLAWVTIDQWVYSPGVAVRLVVAVALLGWSVFWMLRRVVPLLGRSIRKEYAARSLEHDMPEMRQELTSYVTLQDDRDSPGLRSRVVRSIGAQAAGRLRAHDALPDEATGTLKWWIAAAAVLALLAGYSVISPKNTFRSAGRLFAPLASIEPARRVSITGVQPGDAEAIAGRKVEVSASILGLNPQDEIWCRWATDGNEQQAELAFDEVTSRYHGQIQLEHLAAGDVAYRIEAGDATAGPFHLRVQDVPVVAVESIRYEPPSYTGEVSHTSSSASITGVDGTQVTIRARTNRQVVKANIEFNPRPLGDSIRATAGAAEMQIDDDGTTLSISFPLRSAHGRSAAVQLESYRVKVWDAAAQSNPNPIIYPIRVITDLPPEVSIVMPRKSPKDVPIDAQQVIEVHAMDADFGLRHVGLEIRRGIDLIAEPNLWTDPKGAKGNHVSDYRFRAAEHGLRVGDVVQIRATATDNRSVENDPSIESNVSFTDPIKLRITASEPVQDDPAGGDGLSPPDQRPASDADAGDESKQESGEGSPSGGQGASGEGASGKGTSGESGASGAGTSGEGSTGESGESGESGASGQGGTGESESSEGKGSSEGESGTGDSSPTGQATENGEPTKGGKPSGSESGQQTGETPGEGQAPETGGTDSDPGSAEQTQSAEGATDPNGQPMSDRSATGESTGDAAKPSTGDSASGERGADKRGTDRSGEPESGSSETQQSGEGGSEQTGDPKGDPSENEQPPEHDGKAFERIRDHIDEMKRQRGTSGEDSPENGSKQSSESGEPSSASGSKTDSSTGDSSTGAEGATGSEGKPQGESGEGSESESTGEGSESGSNGEATAESESAESGADKSKSGQSESGEAGTGESKMGESETGEPESSEPKPGESKSGESESGESTTGESTSGESKSGKPGSDAAESGESQSRPGDAPDPGSSRQPSSDGSQTQSQTPDQSQSPSQGGSGSGAGTDTGDAAGDVATPPDPVDLEYAKKATDMVLDYLEQTRDKPDRDLLDKLNWTEEDLQQFSDRWKKVREMQQPELPDAKGNRDVEEALRSLGLRPSTQATSNNRGTSDSLRGVRDAGNRKPPPPAYQDAFDAFRRAMGRQR